MSIMHDVTDTATTTATFTLAPTPEQRVTIGRHAGLARVAWNAGIEMDRAWRNVQSAATGVSPDGYLMVLDSDDLAKEWAEWGRDTLAPWLIESGLSDYVVTAAFEAVAHKLANSTEWPERRNFWTRPGGKFAYGTKAAYAVAPDLVFLDGIGCVPVDGDLNALVGADLVAVEVTETWTRKPRRGKGRTKAQRASTWTVTFRVAA